MKSGFHPPPPIVFNGKKRLLHISVEIFIDLQTHCCSVREGFQLELRWASNLLVQVFILAANQDPHDHYDQTPFYHGP